MHIYIFIFILLLNSFFCSTIIESFKDIRKIRIIDNNYVIKSFSGTKRGGIYSDIPDGAKDIKCGKNLCTTRNKNKNGFTNESNILKILSKYKYFPNLYSVNNAILEIKMENVSSNSKVPNNWREQVDEIYEIFEKEQIIPRDLLNVFHCTFKNNTIKIVDFERYNLLKNLSVDEFKENINYKYLKQSKKSLINSIEKISNNIKLSNT
jgi:hypothetical protein